MVFRVIEGGLAKNVSQPAAINPRDVSLEAERRLKAVGYHQYRARELCTGEPVPRPLRYLQMQIAWISEALSGLDPIPEDYTDDKYWPTPE